MKYTGIYSGYKTTTKMSHQANKSFFLSYIASSAN